MSLLDEQDLDQLWEDIGDNYLAWVWACDHSIFERDCSGQYLKMMTKHIFYSADERKWMKENNIWCMPFEAYTFLAFIPGSFSEFRDYVNHNNAKRKPYLITKPLTDLSTAPPILHDLFRVGGYEDIKGKAYGFYTRSN